MAAAGDAARRLVILASAAAMLLAAPGTGLLIPLALLFGVVDAVFLPAVGALPPRLTAPAQLARVRGMRGPAVRSSNSLGPVLFPVAGVTGQIRGAAAFFGGCAVVSLPAAVLTCAVPALRRARANVPAT